jgi:putative hydrolase of the HAD superfamily
VADHAAEVRPLEIRHVLFDADGVLQRRPGGWVPAVAAYAGERAEELLGVLNEDELASLRGEQDFLPDVAARLAEFEIDEDPEAFYADIWLTIEVVPESLALVEAVRRTGRGVHLASNQIRRRAAYMLDELGFADLFDELFVSALLGVAKPSPDYFRRAVERLDADPATVLFVDDHEPNIHAARSVGLVAHWWSLDDGHDALVARLSDHGIDVAGFDA